MIEVVNVILLVIGGVVAAAGFAYAVIRKMTVLEIEIAKIKEHEERFDTIDRNIQELHAKANDDRNLLAENESKVWKYLMDRALAEGVAKGMVKKNSPIVVSEEFRKYYIDFAGEIQEFYRTEGYKLSDEQLFKEISFRWAEQLMEKVCLPLKLDAGACVIYAVYLAKEASGFDVPCL